MNEPKPNPVFAPMPKPLDESEIGVMYQLFEETARYKAVIPSRQAAVEKLRAKLLEAERSLETCEANWTSCRAQWLALAERHYTPPGFPKRTIPTFPTT